MLLFFIDLLETVTLDMGDNMKISCVKAKEDKKSFRIAQSIGMDVYLVEQMEKVDEVLDDLIQKNYHTIFLSNELAGFSQKLMKDYYRDKKINIIIAKSKRIEK